MNALPRGRFARHLAFALGAAVLVRLVLLAVPVDAYGNPDSLSFRDLARSVASTGRLAYVDQGAPGVSLVAFRSLLYPLFLAPFVHAGALALAPVLALQLLFGVGVVALLALVARRGWGESAGVATAWIGALYASAIYFERQVTSEALFTPLLAAGVACAVQACGEGGPARSTGRAAAWAAAGGAALGLAALTRPAGLPAACGVALGWALAPRRAGPAAWAAFALALAAVLAPALVRNRAVLGAPVLLTSGGMNAWIGNGRGTVGDAWVVMARQLPLRGEVGMDRWFWADTWAHRQEILAHLPALLARKAFVFATPLARDGWSLAYRFVFPFALLAPLAAWAVRRAAPLPGDGAAARRVLLAVLASQVALAMLTVPWSRYRSPIEPLLWPLAALTVVELWRLGGRGRLALGGIVALNALVLVAQVLRARAAG